MFEKDITLFKATPHSCYKQVYANKVFPRLSLYRLIKFIIYLGWLNMKLKNSVLKEYDSFPVSGLKNADKLKYNNINLIIGENGAGKTRFLKSLQNELTNKENTDCVVTLYFPEMFEMVNNSAEEDQAYIFDIFKGNIDLDFKDFLKAIENAPDKDSFFEDFKNWINTRAIKEKNKAEKSFNEINRIMKTLIDRQVEINQNGDIYVCKSVEGVERRCTITEAFSFPEMSPGEKILFYFCLFLYFIQNNENKYIFIIDEPECHLHPNKLIFLINKIKSFDFISELWIASHSLFLVPLFDFENIILIENGTVVERNSQMYKKIYNALVGNQNVDIFEFLKSIDSWMYYQWIVEMFALPINVDNLDNKDEQFKIINNFCLNKMNSNKKIKVLDYGAWKCRIYDCLEMNMDDVKQNIEYEAFEPYPDPNYEYNKNIKLYTDYKMLTEDTYDIIILMNVLHEIPVDEWAKVLNNIGRYLVEEGVLIFIEVKNLTHGEQPYGNTGFLILNDQAVRKCFPNAKKISFEENKSNAWVIDKLSLLELTDQMVIDAISILNQTTKSELKKAYDERIKIAKTKQRANIEIHARKYAFISQQYINSEFAIELLNSSCNTSYSQKNLKIDNMQEKSNIKIVPPPINRKDK